MKIHELLCVLGIVLSTAIIGCAYDEDGADGREPGTGGMYPVPIIFDTDMGNDSDDILAHAMLHTLADEGKVTLLAVGSSKANKWVVPFLDLLNTFYGRPDTPIGMVVNGKTPEDANPFGNEFVHTVSARMKGDEYLYPRSLLSGDDAPPAVSVYRRILVSQPDNSVVFVVVGFSTNIAALLDSGPDEHSDLNGVDLVAKKARLLSIMAGNYGDSPFPEWNVAVDIPASKTVYEKWPVDIVASGFEIGATISYPGSSIENDFTFVEHHPVVDAYSTFSEMPYDKACWDLTSVLYAVEPDSGFFDLSADGNITAMDDSLTYFQSIPGGRHRYLIVNDEQRLRIKNRLIEIVTAPPASW
jgi:inosine-uridine nucleoside N-ribohydrolase